MKITIITICFLMICFSGLSQLISVSGTVTTQDKKPVAGVTVVVKGTTNGTVTDEDGKFTFQVPKDATLAFSFIGYETIELPVDGNEVMNIVLKEDEIKLSDVVVVGYGTQKKENLTGSVSSIRLSDTQNRPIARPEQALAGLASGVIVTQASGQPGFDGATIRIRGLGSLGNNNPLVIIDGLEGSFSDINVSDIETISVLKDAASAAIYGSRAANGVVLVTTKSGEGGKKGFKFSYNGYYAAQQATRLTKYVTNSVQYMELNNLAKRNSRPSATAPYSEETINDFRTKSDSYLYPNTDWQSAIIRLSTMMSHHLSANGRGDKINYNFALGYIDQEGILIGTSAKRYTARLNMSSQIHKRLKLSMILSGRHLSIEQPLQGGGSLFTWARRSPPMTSIYTRDGKYANGLIASNHAMAAALEGENSRVIDNWIINLTGEYKIIEGLKLRSTVGVRTTDQFFKVFRPDIDIYDVNTLKPVTKLGVGGTPLSTSRTFDRRRYITLMSNLTYKKVIADDHTISVLAGFNQETNRQQQLRASKNELPNNNLQELDAASKNPTANGFQSDFGIQSYFGRINYNYKERYLFEANARYDGTSNFIEGKRWGLFPSFSAGWQVMEEPFAQGIGFIESLKIRASWGQLGNQNIGAGQFIAKYALGENYSYGGFVAGGAAQTSVPNKDITWETSTQTTVGIDMEVLEGKLSLTLEYYNKVTDDILRSINISRTIGALNAPTVNLASVQNKGIEVVTRYREKVGDIDFSVEANFTTIDNEILKIPTREISGLIRQEKGRSINEFYTIKMLGIFQNQEDVDSHTTNVDGKNVILQPNSKPGDIKFEDFNRDGKIDAKDKQYGGRSIPKYLYGFNATVEYKGIDLSMIWQGVGDVNARTEEEQKPFFNGAGIPQFWVDNSWTEENPNNEFPRLLISSDSNNGYESWINSSFLIEDASFLRLKNVQIGYTIPAKFIEKVKITKCRVYVNATNPLTITSYRGLDPERSSTTGRNSYPNVQVYSMGLNVTF